MGPRGIVACAIAALAVAAIAVPAASAQKRSAPVRKTLPAKRAAPAAPLSPEDAFFAKNRKVRGVTQTASGVQYSVLTPAAGPHPTAADVALINYDGKLVDGTGFDKSQQPTPMPVAAVVPGFSEALKLMAKGEKIRVWIPSRLAYGAKDERDESGKIVIPANSTLVFDIELIDFLPQTVIDEYQRQMQETGNSGGPAPTPAPAGDKPASN